MPPGDPAQASDGNAGILARSGVVPVSVPGLIWKAPGMLLDRDSPLYMRWSHLPRLMPWLVRFLWNGRRGKGYEGAMRTGGRIAHTWPYWEVPADSAAGGHTPRLFVRVMGLAGDERGEP